MMFEHDRVSSSKLRAEMPSDEVLPAGVVRKDLVIVARRRFLLMLFADAGSACFAHSLEHGLGQPAP